MSEYTSRHKTNSGIIILPSFNIRKIEAREWQKGVEVCKPVIHVEMKKEKKRDEEEGKGRRRPLWV